MKKILIVTYYYKHKNAMASVRPMKLAKYLSEIGYSVTVLTSNQKDTWTKDYIEPQPDPDITEIYAPPGMRWHIIQKYLGHRKKAGMNRLAKQATRSHDDSGKTKSKPNFSLKARIKKTLSWIFYFNLAKQEDICMYHGLRAEILRQKLNDFDVVIATYPTYGAFLTGMWMKRTGRCGRLIADFRDPLFNPGLRSRKAEADYDLKCLTQVLNAADQVVCVSEGIADGIRKAIPGGNNCIEVITNGFDPEDVEPTEDSSFDDGRTHFVYTGTLYHGKRCVDMLCAALRRLVEAGKINNNSFVFDYAGPDFHELLNQLGQYGYKECAVDHGIISRAKSLELQQKADALLLLTWNEAQYQGVVPGKLFEYMSGRSIPIIALITGNVSNSEVARIVRRTACGVACEESVATDVDELTAYVDRLINGTLVQNRMVELYSYQHIAQQYSNLL